MIYIWSNCFIYVCLDFFYFGTPNNVQKNRDVEAYILTSFASSCLPMGWKIFWLIFQILFLPSHFHSQYFQILVLPNHSIHYAFCKFFKQYKECSMIFCIKCK